MLTKVKEHPKLFKPEMVVATLEGRKTQTRRIITYLNSLVSGYGMGKKRWNELGLDFSRAFVDNGDADINPFAVKNEEYLHVPQVVDGEDYCWHRIYSRIKPGDRIWVKETFREFADEPHAPVFYRADYGNSTPDDDPNWKWQSPLHMSRRLARILLEVTKVRAQRIQNISRDDCIAEGRRPCGWGLSDGTNERAFRQLWDSINKEREHGWDVNDWVWAYNFKMIDKEEK